MVTRRYFLPLVPAVFAQSSRPRPVRRKVLVALFDGFGPEYLERGDMPNLKRMIAAGQHKTGKGVIPSVTNVNNASLVTGCFPAEHGITTNFFFDPRTGESREMESAEFLLRPTLFEKAARRAVDVPYLSADYIPHTYAPIETPSLARLHTVDLARYEYSLDLTRSLEWERA